MSKLMMRKDWVSTADAARFLSRELNEPVSQTDVLRLGLDGTLQLSIYLPNGLGTRKWDPVDDSAVSAEFGRLPQAWEYVVDAQGRQVVCYAGRYLRATDGNGLNSGFYPAPSVLDLPMFGTETAEVEKEIQRLDGGHELLNRGEGFAFVLSQTGELESAAFFLKKSDGQTPGALKGEMIKTLREAGEIVVRPSSLSSFLATLAAPNKATPQSEKLAQRVETTYLNIIAALLELVQNPRPGRDSELKVIGELIQNYGEKPGISESNLKAKFAAAKRRLDET